MLHGGHIRVGFQPGTGEHQAMAVSQAQYEACLEAATKVAAAGAASTTASNATVVALFEAILEKAHSFPKS